MDIPVDIWRTISPEVNRVLWGPVIPNLGIGGPGCQYPIHVKIQGSILLMEDILHHLGCIKLRKSWDKLPINWCISSIYRTTSLHTKLVDTWIAWNALFYLSIVQSIPGYVAQLGSTWLRGENRSSNHHPYQAHTTRDMASKQSKGPTRKVSVLLTPD